MELAMVISIHHYIRSGSTETLLIKLIIVARSLGRNLACLFDKNFKIFYLNQQFYLKKWIFVERFIIKNNTKDSVNLKVAAMPLTECCHI